MHHYLIVYPDEKLLLHHQRQAGGKILTSFVRSGHLDLMPPGLTIDVAELFT